MLGDAHSFSQEKTSLMESPCWDSEVSSAPVTALGVVRVGPT